MSSSTATNTVTTFKETLFLTATSPLSMSMAVGAIGMVALFVILNKRRRNPNELSRDEFRPFRVRSLTSLNHNTQLLQVALDPDHPLPDVPAGKHIQIGLDDTSICSTVHAYTPVSIGTHHLHCDGKPTCEATRADDVAINVVFKAYNDGRLTPHLAKLTAGSLVRIKGPTGRFDFPALVNEKRKRKLFMCAGGSGVTPILAVAREAARFDASMEVQIAFFNSTPRDVMCRRELDDLASESANVTVTFAVSREDGESWDGLVGRVSTEVLAGKFGAKDTRSNADHAFVCGPPGFVKAAKIAFAEIGLEGRDNLTVF